MRKTRAKAKSTPGVRIIGGQWRGRRLPVADVEGLRPSGDRLRETLFNWLQPVIHDTHCLDLFAGTGALGFEAISRGASCAVLVEQNNTALDGLLHARELLSADTVEVKHADAVVLCDQPPGFPCAPFDLVFIDPPWSHGSHNQILKQLLQHNWLKPGAFVYIEIPVRQEISSFSQLHEIKRKISGEALALLFCYKK